jgi:hypothetical protein
MVRDMLSLAMIKSETHTWWQGANFSTPAASPLFNSYFAQMVEGAD